MKLDIEYADGFCDYHERDFLRFETLITKNLDTKNSDGVYHQSVEEIAADNYYKSGNTMASDSFQGFRQQVHRNRKRVWYVQNNGQCG